jgi:hypothetical protein
MKTLSNETERIEMHLFGSADTGSTLLFEANLLLDAGLADRILWQQKTYRIVQNYGRLQLKKEIEAVHQQLFTMQRHLSFSRKIRLLFTRK